MGVRLSELAALVGGKVHGDETREVSSVNTLEEAGPQELSFVTNPRYRSRAGESEAGALLVGPDEKIEGKDLLIADDPYYALAKIMQTLYPEAPVRPGVHSTAVVDDTAFVHPLASVGPYSVIGARSRVEESAAIAAHVTIGRDCVVGARSRLFPQVVLYDRTRLGRGVVVHAGTVLGSDGFGFAPHARGLEKIPHPGRTVVEDGVEIGANCSIDRAMFNQTRLGRGTKVDNQVQIGHNCDVGEMCLLVSQVGLSGSVRLGDRVVMAGRSGTVGHLEVGDDSKVSAQSVVTKSAPAGSELAGFPAIPVAEWRRQLVLSRRLDDFYERLSALEKRLSQGDDED